MSSSKEGSATSTGLLKINFDFHPTALKKKIMQKIPRSLPYYDNLHVSSENQDSIIEELMKLHPHNSSIIIANFTNNKINSYSQQLNNILRPLLFEIIDDESRIHLENILNELIQNIPKPQEHNFDEPQALDETNLKFDNLPKTKPDETSKFPDNYLIKILIDNFDLLKHFSLTYFNLTLTSNVTKFIVELIYQLNYWEVVHLVYVNSKIVSFLELIGFDIIPTPCGPIVKQPENYLNDNMQQGLLYPYPYPFYNYSYHSFDSKVEARKFGKVKIQPYLDITLKTEEPIKKKRRRNVKKQESVEVEEASPAFEPDLVPQPEPEPEPKLEPIIVDERERSGTVSDLDITSEEEDQEEEDDDKDGKPIDILTLQLQAENLGRRGRGEGPQNNITRMQETQRQIELLKLHKASQPPPPHMPQQYPIPPAGYIYPPPQFVSSSSSPPQLPSQQLHQGIPPNYYPPYFRPYPGPPGPAEQFHQGPSPPTELNSQLSPPHHQQQLQQSDRMPNITPIQNFQSQQNVLPSFNALTECKTSTQSPQENQLPNETPMRPQSQPYINAPPPYIDPITQTITYPVPPMDENSIKVANKQAATHRCNLKDSSTNQPCNKVFYGKNELLRHQEFVHASKKKIYKCIYCQREGSKVQSYPRHDSLARHIRRKHNITGKENKEAVNYAKDNVEVIEDIELSIQQINTKDHQQKKRLKSMQDQFKIDEKQEGQEGQEGQDVQTSMFEMGSENGENTDNEDNSKDKKDDRPVYPVLGSFDHRNSYSFDNYDSVNENDEQ
ncbi:unnamed protein product [Candida verbasci]|uniref:C2H2-type domain-containing protein n=1 Tax=Candida verbasci TaxID=1227364 RepID=A0A9W4TUC5_9ASCO|nr:unnamed protein product [Candida verbasci]